MKKCMTLLLALVMVFACCACSSSTQTATATVAPAANNMTDSTATAQAAAVATTAVADLTSPAAQADIIFRNLNSLRSDENGRAFWYMVTDLDHNGRLEFIAAITEGSGNYTTAKMYEVNASYSGVDPVSLGLTGGQYAPEIIVNSTSCFKDSSNIYHYIYEDTNSDTSANGHYKTIVSLSLANGAITSKALAYQDITYVNGMTIYSFYDENGKEVSDPSSFSMNQVADKYYSGATKTTVNFDWFPIGEATSSQRLLNSYNVFAGTQAPTNNVVVTPAPTVAPPQPTSWIVPVGNPKITKHPTSESVNAGGSCMFVAQAIGYNYMKWQLVSPNGMVYDATSSNPFPATLNIYGSNDQTLTLSNIPLDMNGWSARAVFFGDTESVTSNSAQLYVSAAPAPVYTTISFSPGSGTSFSDTYNYVNVYSSNGQPIHVECIQSGNTGAYYSENVSSGGVFPIQGISGQSVSVSVYASCGDSSAVATYYVNCAPVPSGTTKYGTVQSCDGNSAYVVFDDGSSGTYYIAYMVSNPPPAGARCTCVFDAYGNLTNFTYNYVDPG